MIYSIVSGVLFLSTIIHVSGLPEAKSFDNNNNIIATPPIFQLNGPSETVFTGPIPELINFTTEDVSGTASVKKALLPTGPPATINSRDIIGGMDDRQLWNHTEFPYSAMGRIEREDGVICSASLVGPRHIATARHCLLPYEGRTSRMVFQPNYFDRARLGRANIVVLIYIPTDAEATDSESLCFLHDDLPSEMNRAIFYHLGYPGDKNVFAARPYRQQYVVVTSVGGCNADGPINTNADSFYGQSGGPLWLLDGGVRYQFGVLTAMGTTSTLFAGMQPWLDAVAKAKADFP